MKTNIRMVGRCAAVLEVLSRPVHRIQCYSKAKARRHVALGDDKKEQKVVAEVQQTAKPVDATTLNQQSSTDKITHDAVRLVEPDDETTSVASFRLDNIDEARFVSLPTVSVEGGRAALLPDLALAAALRAGLLAHRRVKSVEDDINAEIAIIGPRFLELQQEVEELEAEMTMNDIQVDDDHPAPNLAIGKISTLREEKDLIFERQLTLRGELQEIYAELRADQMEMMNMLDGCLFAPREESRSNTDEMVDVLHGNEIADNLDVAALQNPVNRTVSTAVKDDSAKAELRRALLYNLHIFSSQLSFAEKQLEYRAHRYCVEREEGRLPAAGDTEADLFEFQRTRELTRNIAAAERDYDEAKAACLAAGIQPPWSHIESGFVDDVEDGYRISLENDLVASLDLERIRRWLQGVEMTEPPMMGTSGIVNTDGQTDAWDVREVGISDSWSMVADGAQKRRIQKCRGQEDAIRKAITRRRTEY